MRFAIRIQSRPGLYLAALYGTNPILTPYRCDACSYRTQSDAMDVIHTLHSLGYIAATEEVAW